jgi:hypothetical protein
MKPDVMRVGRSWLPPAFSRRGLSARFRDRPERRLSSMCSDKSPGASSRLKGGCRQDCLPQMRVANE